MIIWQSSIKRLILGALLSLLLLGLMLPQSFTKPVEKATRNSYHHQSFWFYPWGKSVTHKGVDIFAAKGTTITATTTGIVLFAGKINIGGNVVLVLGPKWRLHYYAHLESITTGMLSWVTIRERIGTVGTTGNAQGKPPHLHYSIITLIPYPWRIDASRQGWKKMFYLNPIDYLEANR
jgi:murein DD-endopeptidase MepM/ murein hydrolase activator NlpD